MVGSMGEGLQQVGLILEGVVDLLFEVFKAGDEMLKRPLCVWVGQHAAGWDLQPAVAQVCSRRPAAWGFGCPACPRLRRQHLQSTETQNTFYGKSKHARSSTDRDFRENVGQTISRSVGMLTDLEAKGAEEHLSGPLSTAGQVASQQSFYTVCDAFISDALLRMQVIGDGLLAKLGATVFFRRVPETHHKIVLLPSLAGVQVAHGVPGAVVKLLCRHPGGRRIARELGWMGGLFGNLPVIRGFQAGARGRAERMGEAAQRDLLTEGARSQQHVINKADVLLVVLQVILHVDFILWLFFQQQLVQLLGGVIVIKVIPSPPIGQKLLFGLKYRKEKDDSESNGPPLV